MSSETAFCILNGEHQLSHFAWHIPPDDIDVKGGISNVQKQLGNAVPSLIAELLGKAITNQFFKGKFNLNDLKLCPPKRNGNASYHIKNNIPKKYRNEMKIAA